MKYLQQPAWETLKSGACVPWLKHCSIPKKEKACHVFFQIALMDKANISIVFRKNLICSYWVYMKSKKWVFVFLRNWVSF
jgi:hypothetical protein